VAARGGWWDSRGRMAPTDHISLRKLVGEVGRQKLVGKRAAREALAALWGNAARGSTGQPKCARRRRRRRHRCGKLSGALRASGEAPTLAVRQLLSDLELDDELDQVDADIIKSCAEAAELAARCTYICWLAVTVAGAE